jgi:hypothetical protein
MASLYRTAGTWGAGSGANLPAVSIDLNFHGIEQRLIGIEPVDITSIVQNLDQLTINYSNSSRDGPYAIPPAEFNWTGPWQAGHAIRRVTFHSGVTCMSTWRCNGPGSFNPNDSHTGAAMPPEKVLGSRAAGAQVAQDEQDGMRWWQHLAPII